MPGEGRLIKDRYRNAEVPRPSPGFILREEKMKRISCHLGYAAQSFTRVGP
jgi:hypothetical protein